MEPLGLRFEAWSRPDRSASAKIFFRPERETRNLLFDVAAETLNPMVLGCRALGLGSHILKALTPFSTSLPGWFNSFTAKSSVPGRSQAYTH